MRNSVSINPSKCVRHCILRFVASSSRASSHSSLLAPQCARHCILRFVASSSRASSHSFLLAPQCVRHCILRFVASSSQCYSHGFLLAPHGGCNDGRITCFGGGVAFLFWCHQSFVRVSWFFELVRSLFALKKA